MADYNKFGRLIKIDGSSSSKWSNYISAKVAGNIVFADLTYANATFEEGYAAGYYIWANGVEYKVANLIDFNTLKASFEAYKTATDASIARIDSSVNSLEDWKSAMGFVIEDTNKVVKITGVAGTVKFDGSEYVDVSVDGSTFRTGIYENKIKFGTSAEGDARKLATTGYVDDNIAALNSSINASLDNINTSLNDISIRLDDASTRLANVIDQVDLASSATGNVATVTVKTTEERGTELTQTLTVKGDEHVKIAAGTDASLNITLNVYNTSIDGLTTDNASVFGAGSIKNYVDRKVANLTGAICIKGSVDSSAALHTVLTGVDASKGNMWVATAEFDYTSNNTVQEPKTVHIESGDQVIITENRGADTTIDAPFLVVERNLDGAVTAGERILQKDHVIIGYRPESGTDAQQVQDSGYTLGGNTSAGITSATADNVLATEKATHEFVEARVADISVNSVSNTSYLTTSAKRDGDVFTVTTGIDVAEFDDASNAVNKVADASTFYKAIKDVTGNLTIERYTDASANITLKMTGGDTSVQINGGKYAIVGGNASTGINLEVKASTLANASTEFEGLAIASDVSTIITANELATAAAFNKVKVAVGLADTMTTVWNASIKAEYNAEDGSTSVKTVVEAIDASMDAAVNRLDGRIDNLDLTNTDHQDSITVGVAQADGQVSVTNASLILNGSAFTHTAGDGAVKLTLEGNNISVGGTDTRWNAKKVNEAVIDLSTMIENISTGFLKTVNGEEALDPSAGCYAEDNYVSVTATATANNETTLDASVLMANPVDVTDVSGYTKATATGIASDAYVKDYVANSLMWECY